MNKLPKSRSADIVTQETGKELLIYDLKINKGFVLNETSKIVYEACNGKTVFNELKPRHKFTDDLVFLALDELKRENLFETGQSIQSPLNGLSCREVIKKVGLATMVALPLITGLIAPTAAHAQSYIGLGRTASGQVVLSGGIPFCAANQAVCNGAATSNVNGCCSGAATLTFNNTDCGGSDPTNVCVCV